MIFSHGPLIRGIADFVLQHKAQWGAAWVAAVASSLDIFRL
jgi:hypothetical protein